MLITVTQNKFVWHLFLDFSEAGSRLVFIWSKSLSPNWIKMNHEYTFLFIQGREQNGHCGLNPEKHDYLLLIQVRMFEARRTHLKTKLYPLPDESPPTHTNQTTNQHKMENELLEANLLQRLSFSCCFLPVQQGAVSAWQSPTGTQRQTDVWGRSLHITPRMEIIRFHYSSQGAQLLYGTRVRSELKGHSGGFVWDGNHIQIDGCIPGH